MTSEINQMTISNTTGEGKRKAAPEPIDIVWGGENIAILIGKTTRATFAMLERGHIPGAKKVGGQWGVSREKLLAYFEVAA
jgi:hypothetical protein